MKSTEYCIESREQVYNSIIILIESHSEKHGTKIPAIKV